jgi:DNA integrity scanning protein DisA with diadenylate cyclase activity
MPSRRDLLELVGYRKVTDIDRDVLVALASMDGATVVDQQGNLLAAGAILLHPPSAQTEHGGVVEGARTTAAIGASRFGPVLKVSEDGVITLFDGEMIWTM